MRTLAALLLTTLVCPLAAWADPGELSERRRALADAMGDRAVLVMFPEEHRTRSNDVSWPYRQSNALYYLTHVTNPGAHLVMVKDGRKLTEYLFAKLSDPHYEVWEGRLPDAETLTALSGIDTVYAEEEFQGALRHLLNGVRVATDPDTAHEVPEHLALFESLIDGEVEVWLDLGRYRRLDSPGQTSSAQRLAAQLRARFPELRLRNVTPPLEALRRIKSDSEIERLQRAIDITGRAQRAAMKRVLSADFEYQVQATIEYTFRNEGACCWAFPSIVASGDNATILHYGENNAPLEPGDLLLADIGAEVDYYSADITRTFPVSGTFSPEQRQVYTAVLEAQQAAIAAARPGKTMHALTQVANRVLGAHLLEMGLVTEDSDEQVKSYFLHGLGHSLGLDTHDAFEYYLTLDQGMVMTMEPGLYVRRQDVTGADWYTALDDTARAGVDAALEKYDGIGVRIEDVIVVTRRGNRVLSSAIPSSIEAIESFMAGQVDR